MGCLDEKNIDSESINAIRFLSADSVQKASSGHPGLPLGCAAIGYELWANHLVHDPSMPDWSGRDRFILSGGHGSTLLYSLLHLFGYEGMTIDELKNFRQLGSLTPGHPEYGHTTGVEASTGPLGQGMAMAVGMAMAQNHMAALFNEPGYPVVDNYTYVLGGDGCLMEGISSESFSLAGTLGLDKLIVLYDSNNITIEGSTDICFTENVCERMRAFGFQVIEVENGLDTEMIAAAINEAKNEKEKPSFIKINTVIGYGCPGKEGTAAAHGEPLGEDNIGQMRKSFGWLYEPFNIPDCVYENFKKKALRGMEKRKEWEEMFEKYKQEFPDKYNKWNEYKTGFNIEEIFSNEEVWEKPEKGEATRASSSVILNKIAGGVENLVGGSADLAPSNKTYMKGEGDFGPGSFEGRNLHFGVREQAMAGIVNGMAAYGGLRLYCSTFFAFSDYVKPMARISSIMNLPIVYIFTHDSIGVGEDGPTHQPIEQLAQWRATPGIDVIRPCDRTETAAAWKYALEKKDGPTLLVLSRQGIPQQDNSMRDISKGGYILSDCENDPDIILIGTGAEVDLCMKAKESLEKEDISVRVVSMPSTDIFNRQSEEYKESVLPDKCRKRVSVEAASSLGWDKFVGLDGATIAIDSFGESAPAGQLFEKYGFTPENIVNVAKKVLNG